LGFGDVIVRTFTGTITLRNIGNPVQVQALIEEYWQRTKQESLRSETQAMESAIRRRLGLEPKEPRQSPSTEQESPAEDNQISAISHFVVTNLFKMRFEEGATIIYRKHWWLLFRRIWFQTLSLLALFALLILRLLNIFTFISSSTMWLFILSAGFGIFLWGFYHFWDWQNDIYKVTSDHIVDVEKKPLGKEETKSAPLENILSLNHERNGILGILLNFGTVNANVGTTVFNFVGVYDPAQVQQDIFRHMDARKSAKEKAEADQERERMAEWLASYHRSAAELYAEEESQKPYINHPKQNPPGQ
jgi:hypothetical protein